MLRSLAVIFCLLLLGSSGTFLAGCSSSGDNKYDETRDWSAERLYKEAKEELVGGNYKKAIGYYEKLESRYPYGRYAQQAQLELGYAYYKDKEPASALAAADRFIKLHPDNPSVDYAYYLKGLVNFNEDLGMFGDLANTESTLLKWKASPRAYDLLKYIGTRPRTSYLARIRNVNPQMPDDRVVKTGEASINGV